MSGANVWSPGGDIETARTVGLLYKGTSETSNTVGDTGTKTFITQADLYFGVGEWLLIVDQNNIANWMSGQVVSYNDADGTMVFAPQVKAGSGTLSAWNIYISGVWINQAWTGGIAINAVEIQNTLRVTGLTTLTNGLTVTGNIKATAGDINLNVTTSLSDADATLTVAQLFGGTLVITPTASRVLTLPTAAQIIAYLTNYEVGSHFEFTIVNNTTTAITVAPGSGIVQQGKTIVQDGSVTFKVTVDSPTVVSVINLTSSILAARVGNISSSQTTAMVADLTLTSLSAGLQLVSAQQDGLNIILPDATTLYVSSPTFQLSNTGMYAIGVKDKAGNLLTVLDGKGQATLSLADSSTLAGVWSITGVKLVPGMINYLTTLSASYGVNYIFNKFVQLDASTSVHFCSIASNGLAAFIVDSVNKTVSAPSTITTTAATIVNGAFQIDATRLIVFYSDATNNLRAVVLTKSGSVLGVGTPTATGAITDIASDIGINAPRIVQLDSNLFVVGNSIIGVNPVTAIGCWVNGANTVVFGSPLNVDATNQGLGNAVAVEKLTTTTAAFMYTRFNGVSTYQDRIAVVSVTNDNPPVCTVGTPQNTLLTTSAGGPVTGVSFWYTKLSASLILITDNNANNGDIVGVGCVITGTSIAVGSPATIDTGKSTTGWDYTTSNADRYKPHLYALDTTRALIWYLAPNGSSRSYCGILTVNASTGAITQGNKISGSFSTANSGSAGFGAILPPSADHFIAIVLIDATLKTFAAMVHKMAGTDITTGELVYLGNLLGISNPATDLLVGKLGQYGYAIGAYTANVFGGDFGLEILRADGFKLTSSGRIRKYAGGARKGTSGTTAPYFPVMSNTRLIALSATRETIAPASGPQLQVADIITTAS